MQLTSHFERKCQLPHRIRDLASIYLQGGAGKDDWKLWQGLRIYSFETPVEFE